MLKFIMMCGLPASGKSTFGKELAIQNNAIYISSDEIRKEILKDENDQSDNVAVFEEMLKRTNLALQDKKNVLYDACNISYKRRIDLLKRLKKYHPYFECYVMYKKYENCIFANSQRNRKVPDYVIKRMIMNFYFPQYFEGWDKIIVHNKELLHPDKTLTELFYGENGLCYIEHENPHHQLSIGNHCIAAYLNCLSNPEANNNIRFAALLHDIGKPFCKEFKDSKGNQIDYAHYYQHHLVSAYEAVPYVFSANRITEDDALKILALITFHMHPYFWKQANNEKMKRKYIALWGEELFNEILILHKADEKAH